MTGNESGLFPRAAQCRATLALLAAALLGAPAVAQAPIPGQGSSVPPRQKQEKPRAALPVFEFFSGFWLNLHHFLYQQARLEKPETSKLTAEELRAWQAALDYYARNLASQDLLFNGDMVAIKNRLAELQAEPDLQKSGLRPALVAALESAAPSYRARWWGEHDRANRAWAAAITPVVERLGVPLAERLAEVYQQPWPAGRIRVDLSYVANWAGAYTSLEPVHVTISSGDPRNQGLAALETLFHEASHALAGGVRDGIARECRSRNKPIPRDLWHAVLFYTTGEVVRRALGGPGGPLARVPGAAAGDQGNNYMPYAYRHGLYARGWQNYLRVLETHWHAYLDGSADFDRAIARMVHAL